MSNQDIKIDMERDTIIEGRWHRGTFSYITVNGLYLQEYDVFSVKNEHKKYRIIVQELPE